MMYRGEMYWCPARGGVHFMLGLKKTWQSHGNKEHYKDSEKQIQKQRPGKRTEQLNSQSIEDHEEKLRHTKMEKGRGSKDAGAQEGNRGGS